jgi:hypothetical protein
VTRESWRAGPGEAVRKGIHQRTRTRIASHRTRPAGADGEAIDRDVLAAYVPHIPTTKSKRSPAKNRFSSR